MKTHLPSLSVQLDNTIGRLTLCNPQKHNALSQDTWLAIPVALQQLIHDGARVIVLSGEGDSFCAGADISEFDVVRKNAETAKVYEKANADAFAAVRECSVPVLAKISKYCLGGGFGLAAATDIRFASDDAQFGVPAARLGLAYPVDAMADITRGVGAQNAKRLLYTGQRFGASDLEAMGFLARVTDKSSLDELVEQTAQQIVGLAPLTHSATKVSIAAAQSGDPAERAEATRLGNLTFNSRDYDEGRRAFKEKRPAKFIGK